jgi:hypothetical protein
MIWKFVVMDFDEESLKVNAKQRLKLDEVGELKLFR